MAKHHPKIWLPAREGGIAGQTPIMEHGKLSITETRAGIGSEEDPWTDKSIQPREIVILRFKLVVGPYVIGTPTEVLGGIRLCDVKSFFTEHVDVSDGWRAT